MVGELLPHVGEGLRVITSGRGWSKSYYHAQRVNTHGGQWIESDCH